jgi:acetyltransferase-like isoleucine patch superfamily enzyme
MANIGKFCSIGPNFLCGWGIHPLNTVSTNPMFYSRAKQNGISLSRTNKIKEREAISIGNDVFIGANVTVLDGVTIGDGAVIGAGAVVSKDIPPYAVAVGCPIKIIKYRFDEDTRNRLIELKWWNCNYDRLKDVEKYFFDVDTFLNKSS